jgi:hypothetical protein
MFLIAECVLLVHLATHALLTLHLLMNSLPIASDHSDSLPMVAIDVATLVAWLSEDFLQSVIHTWF